MSRFLSTALRSDDDIAEVMFASVSADHDISALDQGWLVNEEEGFLISEGESIESDEKSFIEKYGAGNFKVEKIGEEGALVRYQVSTLVPYIDAIEFEGKYEIGKHKKIEFFVNFMPEAVNYSYDAESDYTIIKMPLTVYGQACNVYAAQQERYRWQEQEAQRRAEDAERER